ncbi:hypothetical protein F0P96_01935 [Hymenobacter busanensis]|uniref:Uncharacterized protein n=1 Tax=Hymenobacter busanensis TaxID=2607656 RepID=A0A7L4ZV00_9BACT|nr:hypothetical protein [Hymenobacter busanensis]KAA9339403.1 hypothetical protein F0P96_01935 [Hymenobacter busanensis]QHJ06837.1 hypothetical protein GUY19_05815 [Hymenobacter busanensis]
MGRLLLNCALLLALVLGVLYALAPRIQAGRVDSFYRRFTTAPSRSLILGSSRAAQGLQPRVLEPALLQGGRYEGPLRNFAFTVMHSPYGPAYLAQVKKKLRPDTRHGLFLLAVDPWVLAVDSAERHDQRLRETQSFIGKLNFVSLNPNLEYLLRFWNHPLYQAFDLPDEQLHLHADGWLEVDVPLDSLTVQGRIRSKLLSYRHMARTYTLSDERVRALAETIAYLQGHGQVVLVRLPVSAGMRELELRRWPRFDAVLGRLAARQHVPYLNYINRTAYPTSDGNHLQPEAGRRLSRQVALDILQEL